jgi:hypothetical protein
MSGFTLGLTTAPSCPKCGFDLPAPADTCPKCGLIFAKWTGPKKTSRDILVTTGDLRDVYQVLRPVYFSTSNRNKVLDQTAAKFGIPMDGSGTPDLMLAVFANYAEVKWTAFPAAFEVCVEGIRRACFALGGDAVVAMRQDIDIDNSVTGVPFFYMQMYGTAVKFAG